MWDLKNYIRIKIMIIIFTGQMKRLNLTFHVGYEGYKEMHLPCLKLEFLGVQTPICEYCTVVNKCT